ncbi:hypothetical protein FA13DRAFT_1093681 [Coprinellus micaceus]|uniref:Uncharacterized protein n=1 Tax=Coprinellus micaceus TaxID=71717 RepID=A0A4Y7TTR6_COPMI|nr:hypothetical protein FA13DRAFT_1093681 [Coprinellus micaceus]
MNLFTRKRCCQDSAPSLVTSRPLFGIVLTLMQPLRTTHGQSCAAKGTFRRSASPLAMVLHHCHRPHFAKAVTLVPSSSTTRAVCMVELHGRPRSTTIGMVFGKSQLPVP